MDINAEIIRIKNEMILCVKAKPSNQMLVNYLVDWANVLSAFNLKTEKDESILHAAVTGVRDDLADWAQDKLSFDSTPITTCADFCSRLTKALDAAPKVDGAESPPIKPSAICEQCGKPRYLRYCNCAAPRGIDPAAVAKVVPAVHALGIEIPPWVSESGQALRQKAEVIERSLTALIEAAADPVPMVPVADVWRAIDDSANITQHLSVIGMSVGSARDRTIKAMCIRLRERLPHRPAAPKADEPCETCNGSGSLTQTTTKPIPCPDCTDAAPAPKPDPHKPCPNCSTLMTPDNKLNLWRCSKCDFVYNPFAAPAPRPDGQEHCNNYPDCKRPGAHSYHEKDDTWTWWCYECLVKYFDSFPDAPAPLTTADKAGWFYKVAPMNMSVHNLAVTLAGTQDLSVRAWLDSRQADDGEEGV